VRVSDPQTIWDSKLLNDNKALFWDDQETAGASTTSSYNTNKSSVTIGVDAGAAGTRVRQTKQRFNYQPGKSHLIFITATPGSASGTVVKRVGYFDDNNGLFLQVDADGIHFVLRSYTSGSAVDDKASQANWNINRLDGTETSSDYIVDTVQGFKSPNPYTIDITKAQIIVFDLEWLGVGSVRCGFVIDGNPIYVHQFNQANNDTGVYMTTPNLPIRYEISSTSTGVAGSLECICSTVISEGGLEETGFLRTLSTGGTQCDADTADTIYAVIGTKLKSTHLDQVYRIKKLSMLEEGKADFEWLLLLNPTVAGTFTYSDVSNSAIQAAYGATANTVTGGTLIAGGFSSAGNAISDDILNSIYAGSTISGTADEMVLCVRPLSANADIQATLTYLEL